MKRLLAYLLVIAMGAGAAYGIYTNTSKPVSNASKGHGAHDDHSDANDSVVMSDAKMNAAGIKLETAGAATLKNTLRLQGILVSNQETLAQITPRFPGIVKEVRKRIGDRVEKDELLATVESNQSLRIYELRASFQGVVVDRGVAQGEYASEQKPAFLIADLSTVWVDFAVHRRDIRRLRIGDRISVDPEDGDAPIASTLSYLSPIGSSETQTSVARAVLKNDAQRLRTGLFATGHVSLSEKPTPLAVKISAVQRLENRTVVFVREGDTFKAREVELGERDSEHVEILFGLSEGDIYAATNSFIIKADIAKGSAAHEH